MDGLHLVADCPRLDLDIVDRAHVPSREAQPDPVALKLGHDGIAVRCEDAGADGERHDGVSHKRQPRP